MHTALLHAARTKMLLVAVGLLLPPAMLHGQTLPNGDFADGFITADQDTIPDGWGSTALNHGCCLAFDMDTYHTALGAARVDGCTDTCAWGFSTGVENPELAEGQDVTLYGWIKLQDVSDTAIVGMQTGCAGGGWQKVEWKRIWTGDGTMDWTQFSGTIAIPERTWCDGQYSLNGVSLTVHLDMRGTGTFWADDLEVVGPGGTSLMRWHSGLRQPSLSCTGGVIRFATPTRYTAHVLRPDGRRVQALSGHARMVDISSQVPPGAYLVELHTETGATALRVVVGE